MSTILKALRRLEREREAKPEPALRDQVVARPARAGWSDSRPRVPLLVVAGAAGALLVVALVTLLEPGGEENALAEPEANVLVERKGNVIPERKGNVIPERKGNALAERGATPPPAATRALRPPPSEPRRARPDLVPDAAERAAARAARRTRVAAQVAPAALVPSAPPEASATARALPVDATAAPEPSAPANVTAPPEPVAASELGPALRFQTEGREAGAPEGREAGAPEGREARVPGGREAVAAVSAPPTPRPAESAPQASAWVEEPEPLAHERGGIAGQPEVAARTPLLAIVVERTLWHPDPGRRLAVLQVEGRDAAVELREGDAVGDLVVQQIDPSGVLFLHHGVEIRRRVGARD